MARRRNEARWVKVPGSYTLVRFMGEHRRVCAACKKMMSKAYAYGPGGTTVVCGYDGCQNVLYELELPPPKPAKPQAPADARDERIRGRLSAAYRRLDETLAEMRDLMRKVDKARRRISRLEAALARGAEARREAARKALETRRRPKRVRRGIQLGEARKEAS